MKRTGDKDPTYRNHGRSVLSLTAIAATLFAGGCSPLTREKNVTLPANPAAEKALKLSKTVNSLAVNYAVKIAQVAESNKGQGVVIRRESEQGNLGDETTVQYSFPARKGPGGQHGNYILNVSRFNRGPHAAQVTGVVLVKGMESDKGDTIYRTYTLSFFKDQSHFPYEGAYWGIGSSRETYSVSDAPTEPRDAIYLTDPDPDFNPAERQLTKQKVRTFARIADTIINQAANHKAVRSLP